MRLVTASLIGLLVATPLLAQEGEQQEREHVVRKGDTLWDLAGVYFQNPFRWPLIYQANTSVVEDPHWIYPEEVLRIPALTEPADAAARASVAARVIRPLDRPVRTVFYREPVRTEQEGPTVLTEPSEAPVPVKPGEFTSAEFVADPHDLAAYGRIVRPVREIRDVGGIPSSAHPEDELYIGYASQQRPQVGQRLLVLGTGRRLYGEAYLGARVIRPTAVVEVLRLETEVMVGRVVSQFGPVQRDQLATPLPMFPDFRGLEAEPVDGSDLQGRLFAFVDEQPLYGPTDHGFIDLGSGDGVQVGDVFLAYLPQRAVRSREAGELTTRIEQVPPTAVAELRVLRVDESDATVVVDHLMYPQLEAGLRVRRIRKMP